MEKTKTLDVIWKELSIKRNKTIVLPEAQFSERITLAGIKASEEKIAKIILLTNSDDAFTNYNLKKNEYLKVVNIATHDIKDILAHALFEKRKDKGISIDDAYKMISDPVYFGTMMVELGLADGLVAGAEISTAETFKPAFQIIKGKTKDTKISSFFVMLKGEKRYIFADCGVNIDPTAEEIVQIAKQSAQSAREIAQIKDIRVALLSYSTKGSADGDDAIKMRNAKELLDKEQVDFVYDGEMQVDCAVDSTVSRLKAKDSPIDGKANVFVFPNLSAGNIAYKIMQRFGGYQAIGPIAQGMRKPINDVSRGATVFDIVQAIAITVLQCE